MYAIIRTGGKQYKVEAGDLLKIERINVDLGSKLDLTEVLLVGGEKTFVGKPVVENAKVTAVVTKQAKAPKVIVFKKKRRQGYRRLKGHRQFFTELFITSITSPEGSISKTDNEAPVVDVAAVAEKKQIDRVAQKEARRRGELKETPKTATKKSAKKTVTKKAAKKKTVAKKTAKKKSVTKKAAKKKTVAKKTAKKKV